MQRAPLDSNLASIVIESNILVVSTPELTCRVIRPIRLEQHMTWTFDRSFSHQHLKMLREKFVFGKIKRVCSAGKQRPCKNQ